MKKILFIILGLFIFIPFVGNAQVNLDKYKYTNLSETASLEGYTTHTSSNNADDVKIFLFWGDGCPHCSDFIKYINEYDKKNDNIQLYAFEVWYESANSGLLDVLGQEFNTTIRGVPFIVIGDQYFSGFGETMKDDIEDAINKAKTKKEYRLTVTDNRQVASKNMVNMYVFHGNGCPHCSDLINFIKTDLINNEDIKDYLNIVYYEVWYNENNNDLLEKVGKKLNYEVKGVPFVVIGDQYFSGYGEAMNDEVVEVIKEEINNKKYTDVVAKVISSTSKKPTESSTAELYGTNYAKEEKQETRSADNKKEDNKDTNAFKDFSNNQTLKYIIIAVSAIAILTVAVIIIKHVIK